MSPPDGHVMDAYHERFGPRSRCSPLPPAKAPPAVGAVPVTPQPHMSAGVQELLQKARTQWLKCNEIVELLSKAAEEKFPFSTEAADRPPGGALFLYDRVNVKFFRLDGHEWRKKGDGKAVRETHEKLKLDQVVMLNCYYAHAIYPENLQRRCYWLLESDQSFVIVHYLNVSSDGSGSDGGTSGSFDSNNSANTSSPAFHSGGKPDHNWGHGQNDLRANDSDWQDVRYSHAQQGVCNNFSGQPQMPRSKERLRSDNTQMSPMGRGSIQSHSSSDSLAGGHCAPTGGHYPADDLLHLADDLPDLGVDDLDLGMAANMLQRHSTIERDQHDVAQPINTLNMDSHIRQAVMPRDSMHPGVYSDEGSFHAMWHDDGSPHGVRSDGGSFRSGNHNNGSPHGVRSDGGSFRSVDHNDGSFQGMHQDPGSFPADHGCDAGSYRGVPHSEAPLSSTQFTQDADPLMSGLLSTMEPDPSMFRDLADVEAEQLWNLGESEDAVPQATGANGLKKATCGTVPCTVQDVSPEIITSTGGDRVLMVIDGLAQCSMSGRQLRISIGGILVSAQHVSPGVVSFVAPKLKEGDAEVSLVDTAAVPWFRMCPPALITVAPSEQSLWNVRAAKSQPHRSLAPFLAAAADGAYHEHVLKLTRALLLNMPALEIEAMALQGQ